MPDIQELTDLLEDQHLSKPSLLIDKNKEESQSENFVTINEDNEVQSVELEETGSVEQPEEQLEEQPEPVQEGKYKCRYEGCNFASDSLPLLMAHSKKEHKGQEKPPAQYPPKKKKPKLSGEEILAKEEEKDDKKVLPESLSYLRNQLRAFSARNYQNIISGMEDSPNDLDLLRDLLVASGTEAKSHPYILKRYSAYIGQTPSEDGLKSSTKDSLPGNPLTLLNQMRNDEITDTMYDKFRLANEERKIELEKKKKELKEPEKPKENSSEIIEMSEPVYTENGLPVVDSNGKQVYRKVKYNMNSLGGMGMFPFLTQNQNQNPKSSIELELLKKELEETKKKIEGNTGNSEVNALRQQLLESQHRQEQQVLEMQRKNDEILRKHDEEEKMRVLREESRRDRELFEQKLIAQDKKFEELIKLIADTKKPNIEESLSIKMMEMQKQYQDGIKQMQDNFQNTMREKETTTIFSQLKDKLDYMEKASAEQLRNIKERTDGQVGGVSEAMKDFATDMTHTMELYMKDKEKEKTEAEYKKKLEDIQRTANMSKEQLLTSKGMEIAETAIKGGGEALKGFGNMLNKSTGAAADTMAGYDRVRQSLELKAQGFNPDQITKILGTNGAPGPKIPSAEQTMREADMARNYEKLEKVSDALSKKPVEITPETLPSLEEQPIKFSGGDEK